MRVFISWSGILSRQVATLLHQYLPCMLQEIDVFMSEHDLESGGRWSHQLAQELEVTNYGIICITPENLNKPWILFEAGALTKHVDGRACGILIKDLSPIDFSGPLSQFQNRRFERDELKKLVKDINAKLSIPLDPKKLDLVFDKWWPDIESEYIQLLNNETNNEPAITRRDQRNILEEILMKVRGIEGAIADKFNRSKAKTLFDVFDEMFTNKFTEKQRKMIIDIYRLQQKGEFPTMDDFKDRYSNEEIETIRRSGLVKEKEDGVLFFNKALEDYLSDKYVFFRSA
jgi:hypothetical protein